MEVMQPIAPTVDDDELSALALAADPDLALSADAVSLWDVDGFGPDRWLPDWYMPSPMRGAPQLRGWRRFVILFVIVSFVVINAYGLCNTYGWVAFG
jgi:hypothetical protein